LIAKHSRSTADCLLAGNDHARILRSQALAAQREMLDTLPAPALWRRRSWTNVPSISASAVRRRAPTRV